MSSSFLALNRLRVLRRGHVAYDQSFHFGVNIIRGENGSGKSTIADFIFYILGGEFDDWKSAASLCDQVQAEISTKGGTVTVKRDIDKATTKAEIFFGPLEEAEKHGLDSWQQYPIRRQERSESFSQIMFRAAGIPESPSHGSANITMHQILRLMYSDQRTPAAFLFRYESFDPREIREAVGELICGLNVYETYELELSLRELKKQFEDKSRQLAILMEGLPTEEKLTNVDSIDTRLKELDNEAKAVLVEIENADEYVDSTKLDDFLTNRKSALDKLSKLKIKTRDAEREAETLSLEVVDLRRFIAYLEQQSQALPRAEASAEIVGQIEFTHCPACLSPLDETTATDNCVLCGSDIDPEHEQSKYLQIRLDMEIQIRESRQLLLEKEGSASRRQKDIRSLRREYGSQLSDFTAQFDLSTSPRESFLAARNQRLGQIDREQSYLAQLRERALDAARVSEEKADLQARITRVTDRLKALEHQGRTRRSKALTLVSGIARELLKADLQRQTEFQNPDVVSIRFADNAMSVDGEMNFADSSSVILKNTALLSLFSAATIDSQFFHPRFILLDNVEDKGMEMPRSHNFQKLIVEQSDLSQMDHQIIFTTSMINPDLDVDDYTIGPAYTHNKRTLNIEGV